jgi:hypothetical protein
MKLPMPTANEIYSIANRAEEAIYKSQSRTADVQLIENAIRNALQIVVDRLNIQIGSATCPLSVDLSKS